MNIFKTHISGLDEFLNGGLPLSTYLIMGVPGSGIETFVREVSYRRASESKISYISLNSPTKVIRQDMNEYGFEISEYEKNGKFSIINEGNSDAILDTVGSELDKNRSVVLDNLSDVIYENKPKIAVDLVKLFSKKSSSEIPNFMLLTEGMQDSKIEIALQHYAEAVIYFSSLWEKDSVNRFITVRKLRGGLMRDRPIPYSISENGIRIETSLRIS